MILTELKIDEFVNLLGSDAPAPGGGSASALAGSVGIALTAMVASLTIGKEKYKEFEELSVLALDEANLLKKHLLDAINEDTAAFNKVTDAFALPKESDEDKKTRTAAIQEALKFATKAPFSIMEYAYSAILLTKKMVGKSNTNAASDLGVAALNLKSAIQGAWLNVKINLGSIKDDAFRAEYEKKGEDILKNALPLCDAVYEEILALL